MKDIHHPERNEIGKQQFRGLNSRPVPSELDGIGVTAPPQAIELLPIEQQYIEPAVRLQGEVVSDIPTPFTLFLGFHDREDRPLLKTVSDHVRDRMATLEEDKKFLLFLENGNQHQIESREITRAGEEDHMLPTLASVEGVARGREKLLASLTDELSDDEIRERKEEIERIRTVGPKALEQDFFGGLTADLDTEVVKRPNGLVIVEEWQTPQVATLMRDKLEYEKSLKDPTRKFIYETKQERAERRYTRMVADAEMHMGREVDSARDIASYLARPDIAEGAGFMGLFHDGLKERLEEHGVPVNVVYLGRSGKPIAFGPTDQLVHTLMHRPEVEITPEDASDAYSAQLEAKLRHGKLLALDDKIAQQRGQRIFYRGEKLYEKLHELGERAQTLWEQRRADRG